MSNNENSTASSENGFKAVALQASFTVRDLQTSLAFYQDQIGFNIDQKWERDGVLRSVALRAGDVRILLNTDDGAKGFDRVKGVGMGLMFITAQSVDDVANRIKAHGGTLNSEPADMPWGARVFQVTDPDGFRFTISSERKAPPA